jgi:alkylation response protein AidB-like acyl-CoA dehydrogenase
MDLDLSDEQIWLGESIETLLTREWLPAEQAPEASDAERERLWSALVEFGALAVDRDEGMGAVELCLVARAMGAHLASVPYLASAAVRFAVEPSAGGFGELGDDRIALAVLEPGGSWSADAVRATVGADGLSGRKVAVEIPGGIDRLAVVARVDDRPSLVLVDADAEGVQTLPQPGLDASLPMSAVTFTGVPADLVAEPEVLGRLSAIGSLLAAAESVGAAGRLLEDAKRYASERRQFGHTIGSYQALRHLMADMYVRQTSGWSTVLYAAAALDDDIEDAEHTTAIAKAFVARSAREIGHGALQVFGGIAFTDEHPSHRFLRRIIVREQQFGDAAHHEREIGRRLAAQATGSRPAAEAPSPTPEPVR